MTRDQINKAFRILFRGLLDLPDNSIRPIDQTGTTGNNTELFGTVAILNLDGAEWAQRTLEDKPFPSEDMVETITGHLLLTLSVQFFRAGAYDTVLRLVHRLQSTEGIESMQTLGVGFVGSGPIRDLTTLVDTYYEDRGQVDMTFHVNSVFFSTVRSLVSGQFDIITEPDNHQPFTMEFNQ